MLLRRLLLLLLLLPLSACAAVQVGADNLFSGSYDALLKGKRIGLITNQSALNSQRVHTIDLLKSHAKQKGFQLTALFAPEHGLTGNAYAAEEIVEQRDPDKIPIFSLHGKTKRPTAEMLKNIDLLLFDIQDIGSRSYTFLTTLCYAMEEAAKHKVPVIVLDRPNPLNGVVVDGPLLEERWRSTVGYINVPYCHGMTIGELAHLFNTEYKVGCQLTVVPMKGWKRAMTFADTGLTWIPTSPQMPEATSTWYYPATGVIGELQVVSIGIGYSLPFRVIGAPWIDARKFSEKLNGLKLPGIVFTPFHFRPFFGRFGKQDCHGVLLTVTDPLTFRPMQTQYALLGLIKSMYPTQFQEALAASEKRREMFAKTNGTDYVYEILTTGQYVTWELRSFYQNALREFVKKRPTYLIASYGP